MKGGESEIPNPKSQIPKKRPKGKKPMPRMRALIQGF